jgi:hypothetical protein
MPERTPSPELNAPPATATRGAAFLALALAEALTLGLPDPDYITMHPSFAGSTTAIPADFQFNDLHGQDPAQAMRAWADRFGATVDTRPGDPGTTWHEFEFTHAGIRIHAYANIKDAAGDAPHCAHCGQMQNRDAHEAPAPCACGHPRDSHWEHAEPEGPRQGCAVLGCKCRMYGEYEAPVTGADVLLAAAELDAEMREPETEAEDEAATAPAGDDDIICATPGCGHRDRHHIGKPNSIGRRGCTGDFVDHGCKCGDFTYPEAAAAPETAAAR